MIDEKTLVNALKNEAQNKINQVLKELSHKTQQGDIKYNTIEKYLVGTNNVPREKVIEL